MKFTLATFAAVFVVLSSTALAAPVDSSDGSSDKRDGLYDDGCQHNIIKEYFDDNHYRVQCHFAAGDKLYDFYITDEKDDYGRRIGKLFKAGGDGTYSLTCGAPIDPNLYPSITCLSQHFSVD